MKRNLGTMLLESNLIDEVQMSIAVEEQKRTGRKFGSTLVDLKFVDENVLAAFLSKQIDIPCISLLNVHVPRKLIRHFPMTLAQTCNAVPVAIKEGKLEVAMADPTDADAISRIEKMTGKEVLPLIAPQSSIETMIHRLYVLEGDPDDTLSVKLPVNDSFNDPLFRELVEELEEGDFGTRLERIESRLDEIWTLLEKVLRRVELLDRLKDVSPLDKP
jgi:MSHA biogenesis protein MshE